MTRRDYSRQYRFGQTRTCIDCGAPLPPERRGFYCAHHGRESPPRVVERRPT